MDNDLVGCADIEGEILQTGEIGNLRADTTTRLLHENLHYSNARGFLVG
jgi:hypothetical protein